MKFVAIILSALVFALTSIPCCSFDACEEEIAQTTHELPEQDCGTCSPFVNCGSCHNMVVVQEIPFEESVSIEGFELKTIEFETYLQQEYISTIWQPPRMS